LALDVEQIKKGQRAMWSTGDYPEMATHIVSAAEKLVELAGVREGEEVLDVATGSGNVAIVAAGRGTKVTGLDLTPELFDAARRRMEEAGVEIELVEGDAESMPFGDGSFDCVLSCFGVMFAPRHQQAVTELVRVCRPGGTIGIAAWTPEGATGRMFKTVGGYMPPPPPELVPPAMWGDEQHLRELFEGSGAQLEFTRANVEFAWESSDGWLAYNERVLGPTIMAKNALEPQGRWESLRAELVALYDEANEATDGTMRVPAEYLLTIARLPG